MTLQKWRRALPDRILVFDADGDDDSDKGSSFSPSAYLEDEIQTLLILLKI